MFRILKRMPAHDWLLIAIGIFLFAGYMLIKP